MSRPVRAARPVVNQDEFAMRERAMVFSLLTRFEVYGAHGGRDASVYEPWIQVPLDWINDAVLKLVVQSGNTGRWYEVTREMRQDLLVHYNQHGAPLTVPECHRQLVTLVESRRFRDKLLDLAASAGSRALADLQREARDAASPRACTIRTLSGADLFKALPPTNWLVEGLELAPGAPALWAGFGFTGKSFAAQSLAVAVASGGRAFGEQGFLCRQGRVLHLDFEQGEHLTLARYQKLFRGRNLTPDDIADRLEVSPLPALSLAAPGSEQWLTQRCSGFALCLIDSFRASCPEVDENSSEARRPLDMLNRVSEATGCTFVVIHHARKPNADGSRPGGAKMTIRGSSGLFDACASVLVFEAGKEKGEPATVKYEKARISGQLRDDFAFKVQDVEDGYGNWDGLEVVITSAAEDRPSDSREALHNAESAKIQAAIHAVLEAHPAGLSGHAIREQVGGNRDRVLGNLDLLVADGRVVVSKGSRNANVHRLAHLPALPTGSTT
jgi:hypothetical protein